MITIEIAGTKYEGFESVSISKNIETISGSFMLSATSSGSIGKANFPIRAGDPCKIFIKDEPIINGFVDSIGVRYDAGLHSLDVQGRDRTADVIDSTFLTQRTFDASLDDPTFVPPPVGTASGGIFSAGVNLETVIRATLDLEGSDGKTTELAKIDVINEAGEIKDFSSEESVAAEIGQTLFEFFETYARKRQVLLTTNGNGDIVLARSKDVPLVSTVLQNKVGGGEANNIKSGVVKYDNKDLFHTYLMNSQSNPSGFASFFGKKSETIVEQAGKIIDGEIRNSRRLTIPSKTSDNNEDLANLAQWHRDIRRARGRSYSVVVQGFHSDKEQTKVWTINQLVKVGDDFADVHGKMLIKAVDYNLDLQAGSTTTLHLVPPESYKLEAKIDAATAKANEQGGFLTFGG